MGWGLAKAAAALHKAAQLSSTIANLETSSARNQGGISGNVGLVGVAKEPVREG